MRPLQPDDPTMVALGDAVLEVTGLRYHVGDLAALCNTALKLSVARYEDAALFTSLLLPVGEVVMPWAVPLPPGPAWRALARGFPLGLVTRVRGDALEAVGGLVQPTAEDTLRALVLPGVVGVTANGQLLCELRPGEAPVVLPAPRPSLGGVLQAAGLSPDAGLTVPTVRSILHTARRHRHGATVVVVPDGVASDGFSALAGAALLGGQVLPAEAVGRLTAVDGAVVLDVSGRLHGFGLRLNAPPIDPQKVRYADRVGQSAELRREGPSTGSRRRSAVDFVASRSRAFALVLSSDGPLSLAVRTSEGVVVQRGLECLL